MNETSPTNPRLDYLRSQIGNDMSTGPSPLGRWLKGTLRAAEHGRLVADFTVREEMTNPMGILHGGAAAAILDELVGAMVFVMGREYAYTSVNLNVDFLHSARLGETITVTAEAVRAGKNIIHAEGVITAGDGKIIAKCTSNLIQTSLKLAF